MKRPVPLYRKAMYLFLQIVKKEKNSSRWMFMKGSRNLTKFTHPNLLQYKYYFRTFLRFKIMNQKTMKKVHTQNNQIFAIHHDLRFWLIQRIQPYWLFWENFNGFHTGYLFKVSFWNATNNDTLKRCLFLSMRCPYYFIIFDNK